MEEETERNFLIAETMKRQRLRIKELEKALLTAHACIERENVNGIYQNTFEVVTKALKK